MEKGRTRDLSGGEERREFGIAVVKTASFLVIIYLSAVGPEERDGGKKQAIKRKRQEWREQNNAEIKRFWRI